MKPAGEAVRVAQGLLVLRASEESPPEIGSPILDEQLERVGRVVDVFGPVDRPYVAVTPEDGRDLPALVGRRLYEREET